MASQQSRRTLSRKMYKQIRRGIITNDSLDVRHRFTFMLLLCSWVSGACMYCVQPLRCLPASFVVLPQSNPSKLLIHRPSPRGMSCNNTKQIDYHHQDIPVDCYLNTATHTSPHPQRYESRVERDYTFSQSLSVSSWSWSFRKRRGGWVAQPHFQEKQDLVLEIDRFANIRALQGYCW